MHLLSHQDLFFYQFSRVHLKLQRKDSFKFQNVIQNHIHEICRIHSAKIYDHNKNFQN